MLKIKLWSLIFLSASLGLITACKHLKVNSEAHCIRPALLYKAADMRKVETLLFQEALNCTNSDTVKVALVNLGRIGGEDAANLILSQIRHKHADIRKAAAFAAGISLSPEVALELAKYFEQETDPAVQESMALAIGNLGHEQSASSLYKIINDSESKLAARGAMQGLGVLALFHRGKINNKQNLDVDKVITYLDDPQTSLEASFLLARVPLINSQHAAAIMTKVDTMDLDTQAFVIRALGNLKLKDRFDWFYQKALSDDIGIRVSAIQALGKLPTGDQSQIDRVNELALSKDWVTSVTSIESAPSWLKYASLKSLLRSENSWVAAMAFTKTNDPKPQAYVDFARNWLTSSEQNLQRAAINYFVEHSSDRELEVLTESEYKLTANGAKLKLGQKIDVENPSAMATPEKLEALPKTLTLKTTKGDIKIRLFADTPYTSANFVRLAKEGFYDKTYFHRVIANFVAQGGSRYGDGNGTVDYTIREELNQRSHRFGTIGMATAGKDTAGGQFFINLAPNLHLDSNYTVFGEVISGMDVALNLQQNDQIETIKID